MGNSRDPLQIRCPRCKAKPGVLCHSQTGEIAKTLHPERSRKRLKRLQVQQAFDVISADAWKPR
jgi:hypothetical protein